MICFSKDSISQNIKVIYRLLYFCFSDISRPPQCDCNISYCMIRAFYLYLSCNSNIKSLYQLVFADIMTIFYLFSNIPFLKILRCVIILYFALYISRPTIASAIFLCCMIVSFLYLSLVTPILS